LSKIIERAIVASKVRLDRFWTQQEVMYDWTTELAGIGDRSEYVEKND